MRRSTASVEKRLIALDALLTFVGAAVDPVFLRDETFEQIKSTLSAHIEQARAELMNENTLRLSAAFKQQDVAQIAVVFGSLSRSGFWGLLSQAMNRLGEGEREDMSRWAIGWLDEMKRRGEQASPYPDSIDFAAAGIDIAEYTAMTDLCKYIASTK